MRIIAVDPGFSGAFALVVDGRPMLVGDMPVAGEGSRRRVAAAALMEAIRDRLPDLVVVENVHSFPGQGVASSFRFGVSFGVVLGVVGALRLPLELVEPGVWKRHQRLLGAEKEASRQRALDLAPHLASDLRRKLDHGRAEALLIGLYAAATFQGCQSENEPGQSRAGPAWPLGTGFGSRAADGRASAATSEINGRDSLERQATISPSDAARVAAPSDVDGDARAAETRVTQRAASEA